MHLSKSLMFIMQNCVFMTGANGFLELLSQYKQYLENKLYVLYVG